MASPTQLVQFTFAGGIDQSIRSEALDPTASFVLLENGRAASRAGYEKRPGFDAHTGTERVDATSRTAGYRQFSHGKQTCVIDRDVLDSYTAGEEIQISRGRVPECGLSMMKVPAPGVTGTLTCTDAVMVGAYLALTYNAGQSVYAALVEAETGQVIVAPTLIYTGSAAEVYGLLAARGTTAMLFVICSGEPDIQLSEIDCSTATAAYAGWSVAASTASDNAGLTMAAHSIGTRAYLAYVNDSAGASQVTVVMYDGGVGGSATVNTSSATPGDVGLGGVTGDTLWVAWNETTAIKVKGLSTTNLATVPATAATVITAANAPAFDGIAVVASSTAGAGRLFVNNGDGTRLYTRNFTTSGGAVTPGAAAATHWAVQMNGRPFRVGSRYYGICRGQDSTEKVAILCDLTETNAWLRPVANVAPALASSFFTCQAAQKTTREFWAPIGIQTAGSVTGVQMARFDFDADARWRAVAHNGMTFLSGGLVSTFDGVRVAESAFLLRPPAPTAADSGGGSGLTGVYRYVAAYEQVDAAGNWHLSGISSAGVSPSITDNTMTVTYKPLGISARISAATDPSVRISLYRTKAGGEPPYYFLTSVANTLTAASFTYADSTSDTVLGANALLMTNGNLPNTGAALDRRAVQGCPHLCSYNGFLVAANGEEVFWTGQDVDGEGSWWNDQFSALVAGGGDITALEAMDGTLFVFKRDRIFAMAGEPPNDSGTIGGLGAPMRLAVDVGAVSPFTCVTERGLFFISPRGVEVLSGRSVQFIGEAVKDTFALYPHVSAVTYEPSSSCVYIECSAGRTAGLPTGNGRTLIYDTKANVWRSVDRRSVSATADVAAADGCMVWDGSAWKYGWLRSNGATYVESGDHNLDPGDTWVRQYGKTAYVKLAGIQGQQVMNRALLLAKKSSSAGLSMSAGYDYDPSFETAATWTSTALDTLSTALGRIQVGHDLHVDAEGQAVAVELYDTAPAAVGDGTGATWIALTFEGQPRENAVQLSQEAR